MTAQPRTAAPARAAWTMFLSDRGPRLTDDLERCRLEILDLFLESPGEFVVRLDPAGRVEFVSPSLSASPGCASWTLETATGAAESTFVAAFRAQLAEVWDQVRRPPFGIRREMMLPTAHRALAVAWKFEALIQDGGVVSGAFGLGRDVSERRRTEDALRQRLAGETLPAAVSSRLMVARAQSMREVFDYALAEIGRSMEADFVSMHELAADHATVDLGRVWRRDRREVEATDLLTTLADLDWLRPRLEAGEIVAMEDVGDLPADAEAESRLCEGLGLRSFVVAPFLFDGVLVGLVTLSTIAASCTREEKELRLLRILADQITSQVLWLWEQVDLAAVSDCFLSFGPAYESNLEAICAALGRVSGAAFTQYDRRRGEDLITVVSWNASDDLPRATAATGRVCADVITEGGDDARDRRSAGHGVRAHQADREEVSPADVLRLPSKGRRPDRRVSERRLRHPRHTAVEPARAAPRPREGCRRRGPPPRPRPARVGHGAHGRQPVWRDEHA
jgi:hypothetical protein